MGEQEQGSGFERVLASALQPVEPPKGRLDLPDDLRGWAESRLSRLADMAGEELTRVETQLREDPLQALADPRNWVRPAVAIAVGGAAGAALVLVRMRRRRRPSGLRGVAAQARSRIGA